MFNVIYIAGAHVLDSITKTSVTGAGRPGVHNSKMLCTTFILRKPTPLSKRPPWTHTYGRGEKVAKRAPVLTPLTGFGILLARHKKRASVPDAPRATDGERPNSPLTPTVQRDADQIAWMAADEWPAPLAESSRLLRWGVCSLIARKHCGVDAYVSMLSTRIDATGGKVV
jgi:hypothetical protein